MFEFGERHPIAFEIVLIVISFFAAALFSAAGNVLDLHPDPRSSAGRIIVAAAFACPF